MQFLFVMDPPETMLPDKDTTFAFIRGARARGHQSWHCLPQAVTTVDRQCWARSAAIAVSDSPPHVSLGSTRDLLLSDLDAVFIRKDPPFDADYLYLTQQLDLVTPDTLVVNSPHGLRDANEKLFALHFQRHIPRTIVSASPNRLLEFLTELGGTGVLKPLDGAGGFGVFLLNQHDPNTRALIDLLTLEGKRKALLQQYLPAVHQGDKRVLVLDGNILGAIRRLPVGRDIRANIHVGGSVEPTDLTEQEAELTLDVANELSRRGLWFTGLDLIDGRLIEINVTSPTGLQQLARHLGRAVEQDVIAWVETRSRQIKQSPRS